MLACLDLLLPARSPFPSCRESEPGPAKARIRFEPSHAVLWNMTTVTVKANLAYFYSCLRLEVPVSLSVSSWSVHYKLKRSKKLIFVYKKASAGNED